MTRKEEIQKLIDEETGIDNYGSSDYQIGVCDGVRFADKTMLDRACEWLAEHISPEEIYEYETDETPITYLTVNSHDNMLDFINDFRQAMEGE